MRVSEPAGGGSKACSACGWAAEHASPQERRRRRAPARAKPQQLQRAPPSASRDTVGSGQRQCGPCACGPPAQRQAAPAEPDRRRRPLQASRRMCGVGRFCQTRCGSTRGLLQLQEYTELDVACLGLVAGGTARRETNDEPAGSSKLVNHGGTAFIARGWNGGAGGIAGCWHGSGTAGRP